MLPNLLNVMGYLILIQNGCGFKKRSRVGVRLGKVRICGNFCGVLGLVWRRVGDPYRGGRRSHLISICGVQVNYRVCLQLISGFYGIV